MNEEAISLRTVILSLLFAGVGGAVKYIAAVIKSSEPVTNKRFLWLLAANVFISSFCGLMGLLLMATITSDYAWQGLTAGLFGYLGTTSLDIAMLVLKKKIDPVSSVMAVPPSTDPGVSPK